jgi:hypothetical protein
MVVQEVRWDSAGIKPVVDDYAFIHGKGTTISEG